ncbi:MAG: cytochrome P460 family protein, partial [Hydrogenophilaceae bacterium]|nr:cytochrome P460 family protein [Hydrogenophilaceae bacterium]
MKAISIALLVLTAGLTGLPAAAAPDPAPAPNGISLPADYQDWRLISPSYRTDKKHVRAVLGNDTAINAARAGKTLSWPDGSILAKLVWKEAPHDRFPAALEPGE